MTTLSGLDAFAPSCSLICCLCNDHHHPTSCSWSAVAVTTLTPMSYDQSVRSTRHGRPAALAQPPARLRLVQRVLNAPRSPVPKWARAWLRPAEASWPELPAVLTHHTFHLGALEFYRVPQSMRAQVLTKGHMLSGGWRTTCACCKTWESMHRPRARLALLKTGEAVCHHCLCRELLPDLCACHSALWVHGTRMSASAPSVSKT